MKNENKVKYVRVKNDLTNLSMDLHEVSSYDEFLLDKLVKFKLRLDSISSHIEGIIKNE